MKAVLARLIAIALPFGAILAALHLAGFADAAVDLSVAFERLSRLLIWTTWLLILPLLFLFYLLAVDRGLVRSRRVDGLLAEGRRISNEIANWGEAPADADPAAGTGTKAEDVPVDKQASATADRSLRGVLLVATLLAGMLASTQGKSAVTEPGTGQEAAALARPAPGTQDQRLRFQAGPAAPHIEVAQLLQRAELDRASANATLRTALAPLVDGEPPCLAILVTGATDCGSRGCPFTLYRKRGAEWVRILQATTLRVTISGPMTNGMRDLVLGDVRWQFDGSQYQPAPPGPTRELGAK